MATPYKAFHDLTPSYCSGLIFWHCSASTLSKCFCELLVSPERHSFFFFPFLQFWAFAYFILSIWNDLFLSICFLSHCPPGIPTHSSRYTSVIFPMKTALHSCLGCCFLFCTMTVISIALHYGSNHHWTADVYFYVLLADFELLEGRDQFLYLFNLKEYFNIIYFIKKNEVTAYIQ